MKKMLIIAICMLLFSSSIAFIVTANILSATCTNDSPPNPPVINGLSSGKIKQDYDYSFTLTDPDGDSLSSILIEWGDKGYGNTTYICWTCTSEGPKPNGTIFITQHSWRTTGDYSIRAKVTDTSNLDSDWGTLTVSMPCSYTPKLQFLALLFQRFPNAFPILQYLLEN